MTTNSVFHAYLSYNPCTAILQGSAALFSRPQVMAASELMDMDIHRLLITAVTMDMIYTAPLQGSAYMMEVGMEKLQSAVQKEVRNR